MATRDPFGKVCDILRGLLAAAPPDRALVVGAARIAADGTETA